MHTLHRGSRVNRMVNKGTVSGKMVNNGGKVKGKQVTNCRKVNGNSVSR